MVFLEINGYQIVPMLKDINNDLKVIITTDKNSIELESKCRTTGLIYYAIKPLDFELRVSIIKSAVVKQEVSGYEDEVRGFAQG